MRGWALLVLPLLAVLVRGQTTPAEKKEACKNSCNFASCYHITGDSVSTRSVREVVNALTLDCYRNATCPCHFGAIMYKEVIDADDYCAMWPKVDLVPKQTCVKDARDKHRDDTTRYDNNDLEKCLNLLNNDPRFLDETTINRQDCAYTVAIASYRVLTNSNAVRRELEILKSKNVHLHCSYIGNPANDPLDPVYSDFCDESFESADFNTLRQQTETLFSKMHCCRNPPPFVTTTTTPTTTTTTPTTTTTTPTTTTTTTTTTPRPSQPCDGCAIINGVGYNPHPTRCDCWIRCYFGEGKVVNTITNCCGCGMFWDQDLLTCIPATDKTCAKDPCLRSGVSAWPFSSTNDQTDCRGYWTCADRRTVSSSCCLEGQEFNSVTGTCDQDTGGRCKKRCPCEEESTETPLCEFEDNPNDPKTYYARQYNNQRVLMSCAPGLNFNKTDCKCSVFVLLPQVVCGPSFDMRCTEDPLVDFANNVYIGNQGVKVDTSGGQCPFSGNDRVFVPRFANHDFRDKFAIKVSFNGGGNDNDNKPIFSNTDCREEATVEIKLVREGVAKERKIEGFIRMTNGQVYSVTTDYRENIRNDVYFFYNGDSLNMCVQYSDDNSVSVAINQQAKGLVRRCHCAAQIGYGWDNRYFTGRIYETKIFTYCVPDGFCPTPPIG